MSTSEVSFLLRPFDGVTVSAADSDRATDSDMVDFDLDGFYEEIKVYLNDENEPKT